MDYERIKALRDKMKSHGYTDGVEELEAIFPELRESEDERIRKEIRNFLIDMECKKEWIAYMEKQKELDRIVPEREATDFEIEVHEIIAQARSDKRLADKDVLEQFEQEAACSLMWKAEKQLRNSEKQKEQKSLINKINENIRERLIEYFQSFLEGHEDCYKVGGYVKWEGLDVKDILAYLEGKPDFCHHEVDFSDCSDEYRRAYYDGWNNCNQQHAQLEAEQKPAWSEEDEKIIDTIVSILGQYIDYKAVSGTGSGYATPRYSKEIAWLKSLRPSWKPSEEQMNCLCATVDAAIRKHNESVSGYKPAIVLKSLYEQLKKLIEE